MVCRDPRGRTPQNLANNADESPKALAAPNTDCIYFRYLSPKEQMDAVRGGGKRSFIAGTTVSGHVPDNWRQAADVGIDGILTDFNATSQRLRCGIDLLLAMDSLLHPTRRLCSAHVAEQSRNR